MRFEILDVGHGFCAWLRADNGNVMLFDCGHRSFPEFRPSRYLLENGVQRIDRLLITNYDEDHISDLPQIVNNFPITLLYRNRSVSSQQLREIKRQGGPISDAMETLLGLHERFVHPVAAPPEFPGVEFDTYMNYFPTFEDTNNLSMATFLTCNGTKFLMPGDLEVLGWNSLLEQEEFCDQLRGVHVLVASHHGRENGYCERVFEYCRPNVIVFSDGPILHPTQEMSSRYAQHASGITFNGALRKVLSTRLDGAIWWKL